METSVKSLGPAWQKIADANLKSEGWGRSTNRPPGVIYMKSLDPEDAHNVCVTTWTME